MIDVTFPMMFSQYSIDITQQAVDLELVDVE